jgi:6-phosphofructokinase 1
MMGARAVDLLVAGASKRIVGYKDGSFVDFDIEEGLAMTKDIDQYMFDLSIRLSK